MSQEALKNGRPKNSSYTDFQLGVIKMGVEEGTGYRKIAKKYASTGITAEGAKRIVKKLKNGGGLIRKKGSGRPKTSRTSRNIKKVAQIVENDPRTSQRKLVKLAGAKRGSVRNIISRDLKMKAVKSIRAHKIPTKNYEKRLKDCLELKKQIVGKKLDPPRIFFADEKLFNVGSVGSESAPNYRVLVGEGVKKGDVDPKVLIREKQQGGVQIMVSLGACSEGLGSLQFVEKGVKIDQVAYLNVVKTVYHPDMELVLGRPYISQQDGATA